MISGGGRPHGSVSIGDGLLYHPLTLPEIKACQTSSSPAIRTRARLVDLAIEVSYTEHSSFFPPSMITLLTRSGVAGCS